jgi:ATP-binding cassette subfamily C protein
MRALPRRPGDGHGRERVGLSVAGQLFGPVEMEKLQIEQPTTASWKSIAGYARPYWKTLIAGGVLLTVGGFVGLVQPLLARQIVEALGDDEPIRNPIVLLIGLILVGALISAFGAYLLERTAESVVRGARMRLIEKILWLRLPSMEKAQPGDLMSRVSSDTTLLRQAATYGFVQGLTQTILLVGIVIMMAYLDLVLLGVTLGVLLIMGLIIAFAVPRIQRATKAAQESVGAIGAELERVLGAFRTVKASGAEPRERAEMAVATQRAWENGVEVAKWQAIAGTAAWGSVQIAFLVVLGVGGARVASGAIPIATLVAFLLYLFYLVGPIGQLVEAVMQFQQGSAALSRIDEVLTLEDERDESTVPVSVIVGAPVSVTFDHVWFRYRPELEPVLNGVSFEIPPRGMTALVGPSGAGKTTIFSLIERFYQPDEGRVLLDGQDVASISLPVLRGTIGYVEQDSPVMAGTLRDNLRFAAPDATDAEILEAMERTRLIALLSRLPDGLDTSVGHRGLTLSGGERQRIAIARALLRNPRLLLLDEATSQLDALNELALRETIADIARETTVLVVAHRLSTVILADRIIVLDAGVVRAVGTHDELVDLDALYRELAATQLLAVRDEDEATVAA